MMNPGGADIVYGAELFRRSAVVFGKIFPERLCDHVSERKFVVNAVVRDGLL